ncbi:hypothetical protein JOC95_001634 [Bacillus tianshenii]|uniref:Uncharacterized protein n=1 Tax=Sutcliffiella tianshenii TaxID=1463404 RepID=A0ABS2NYL9_9BACI|nr:hypothetical protein [Bacillus tianshenii]MBM7619782.1 hypothetical protein [Bacillus tianshenii]
MKELDQVLRNGDFEQAKDLAKRMDMEQLEDLLFMISCNLLGL